MTDDLQKPKNLLFRLYFLAAELLYHELAWAYDVIAWLVSFGYWSEWRRVSASYLVPGRILETGFGTGSLLTHLAQVGGFLVGMEPSREMQCVTARKLKKKGLVIPRVRGRTEATPFVSHVFSSIVSTFPTAYIAREATLREFRRIVTSEGRVVILGVGVNFQAWLPRLLMGWFLSDASGVLADRISRCAEDAGFRAEIVQHQGKGYTLPVILLEPDNG